jgi:hypothetical protein
MLFHIGALWRLYELRADRRELANATQRCAFAPLRGRARHDREQL